MPLTFVPVQQLVDVLVGAGLSASANPEDVNLPGAWVTVEQITPLTMDGALQLSAVVYLVAGDSDYTRAYSSLAELYGLMAGVLVPDGPVVPQGVVMPGNATVLPALRVPVNLIDN